MKKIGIIMDPITHIKIVKDTTFALMLEAQKRQWQIYYMEIKDLFLKNGVTWASMKKIQVQDNNLHWFDFEEETTQELHQLDMVFLRKDPPFTMEYLYTTYLLERAEAAGTKVFNNPRSVRDANEKLFTAWFSQCCPETLVTSKQTLIKHFLNEFGDIICKPLDGMGGAGIFRLQKNDPNTSVILETVTQNETKTIMVQRYLPEVRQGDKRILMIDGNPIPYALARIPSPGETRANLAAGGHGEGIPLTDRDHWICQQVGPILKEKGLLFVGLDVIGDYLTEINVTSPTCARELDQLFQLNISAQWLDAAEKYIN
ncbi:MAG: Glutathione synthetase [Legionellaceae bacterium]